MRLHAAQGHAMADLSSVINLYQESGNHVEALRQPQHAVQPPAVAAALCRRPRRVLQQWKSSFPMNTRWNSYRNG
jgi:hypothetical protein